MADGIEEFESDQNKWKKKYSDDGFWEKIKKILKFASKELIEKALYLYYGITENDFSTTEKAACVAALGYLISPVDAIPDVIPVIGLSDDLAVVGFILYKVWDSIKPATRKKAEEKAEDLFN